MLRKLKIQKISRICLTVASLFLISCPSPSIPSWKAKIYAGDSQTVSIRRSQDNESIPCNEPKFDNYACVSYEDLAELYDILLQCGELSSKATEYKAAFEFCGLWTNRNYKIVNGCLERYKNKHDN